MSRDLPKPALPQEKRRQPFLDPLGEHVRVQGRNRGVEPARESGAVAELTSSFVPRQQLKPMLANAVEQGLLDRALIRRWIGAGSETDGSEAPAASRRDGACHGIELAIVPNFDPVPEQLQHGRLVDGCGRLDAGAGGMSGDLPD